MNVSNLKHNTKCNFGITIDELKEITSKLSRKMKLRKDRFLITDGDLLSISYLSYHNLLEKIEYEIITPRTIKEFKGFLVRFIRFGILDYLRDIDTLSTHYRKLYKKDKFNYKELDLINDENQINLLSSVSRDILNSYTRIEKRCNLNLILENINKSKRLNNKEKTILIEYYYKDRSLYEISRLLKLKKTSVTTMKYNSVKKLKKEYAKERYINDKYY